jgi:hypothetical protein
MQKTRLASVALAFAVVAPLICSARVQADVQVNGLEPPQPSRGQVVLILTDAQPGDASDTAAGADRVLIEQDGRTQEAFIFSSATRGDAIFARLPGALRPGRASVVLEHADGSAGEPYAFDVSSGAAAPAVWAIYPFAGDVEPVEPIDHARAGDRLLLFGAGLDTTGVTVIVRHGAGRAEIVPAFAHTSGSVGVAPVFDLPSDVPPGPVRVSTRVRVCDDLDVCGATTASRESEAIELVVH